MNLCVDVYSEDLHGHFPWKEYAKLGSPWNFAMIKATEGTHYLPAWFATNWRAIREAGGERYGVDFFRATYHFAKFNVAGKAQALFHLKAVEGAGGWGMGDLFPVIDVELGNEGNPARKIPRNTNWNASAQQIIDVISEYTATMLSETGRPCILYGNGAMRDKGIKNKMGCKYMWPARYTGELPRVTYERAGFAESDLIFWQYSGDDDIATLKGYPDRPPCVGDDVDVSALVLPGGLEALRGQLWAEKI